MLVAGTRIPGSELYGRTAWTDDCLVTNAEHVGSGATGGRLAELAPPPPPPPPHAQTVRITNKKRLAVRILVWFFMQFMTIYGVTIR